MRGCVLCASKTGEWSMRRRLSEMHITCWVHCLLDHIFHSCAYKDGMPDILYNFAGCVSHLVISLNAPCHCVVSSTVATSIRVLKCSYG